MQATADSGRAGHTSAATPAILGYSLLLGIPFAGGWLFYTAAVAEDGRERITEWLDPMLAGLTLTLHLLAIASLLILWPRLAPTAGRRVAAGALVTSQWAYVFGEILSNTITVGEPPRDVGSLVEIAAGVTVTLAVLGVALSSARGFVARGAPRVAKLLTIVAMGLAIGLAWWLSHPIDQAAPGAPRCVPGNPLYNAFHGPCP